MNKHRRLDIVLSALVVGFICTVVHSADNCNNGCRAFDFQRMPGNGCGRYTPTHARGSTITWSPDGDTTKEATDSKTENDNVTYTLTNITTCEMNCLTSTQTYGFSLASSFVINDSDLEVILVQTFLRKYCTQNGS